MARHTSHLFRGEVGQINEVESVVADTPEEWDAMAEANQLGWSVDRGTPTVALRLTRTLISVPFRTRPSPDCNRVIESGGAIGDG